MPVNANATLYPLKIAQVLLTALPVNRTLRTLRHLASHWLKREREPLLTLWGPSFLLKVIFTLYN